MDEDAALLRTIAGGDDPAAGEAAFGKLVDRHAGYLYGVARALLGNVNDAEDVVQEAFAAAFESAGAYRGEASARTWLVKILVRRAARSRRSGRRWRFLSLSGGASSADHDGRAPDLCPAVSGPAAGVQSRLDVADMLAGLSAEHREVLVLRELRGMSYEEMAAALGVPRGTVESRLHRARRELKDRFAGYFE